MKIISGVMLLASLCLATVGSVPAQPAAPTPPTETPRPGPPADAFGRATPHGAVVGYLAATRDRDFARAAEYLDLRRLPRNQREAQGPDLARQLKVVLDQDVSLDPDVMSEAPEGRRDDEMPPTLERLTTIHTEKGNVDVVLERVRRDDGALVWKFSAATMARVPALYDEVGRGPLGDVLPSVLFEQRLFQIALWQWIGLLLLVVIAYSVAVLLGLAIFRLLRLLVGRFRTPVDNRFFEATIGPVRLGVGLALFSAGRLLLALPVPVAAIFATMEKVAALVSVTWLLLRIIDVVGELTTVRLIGRGHVAATSVVPLGRKSVKVVVFALGFIAVLQNVGVNVTGLLAGLGIGGLAIALAAQKTVENLFGGIALTVDQPVRIGDLCRFGGTIGVVEEVGLRSTRIRTPDRSVVSIPNAEFSSLHLENLSKRDRIWLRTVIGLRYETTPDQLRYVLVQIRAMLYAHPKIHPEPLWTRFVSFGASTLDVEVFAYAATADQKEFFAIREDIYLRIMDIVRESGTGFAFPSQTMYVRRDGPLDDEKRGAAEAQVRVWRAEGELGLPEFSERRIAALARTLDYPPVDAAPRKA